MRTQSHEKKNIVVIKRSEERTKKKFEILSRVRAFGASQ